MPTDSRPSVNWRWRRDLGWHKVPAQGDWSYHPLFFQLVFELDGDESPAAQLVAAGRLPRIRCLYPGYHGVLSVCWLEVLSNSVVVVTEAEDNPGTSITNKCESLAAALCEALAIPLETLRFVRGYEPVRKWPLEQGSEQAFFRRRSGDPQALDMDDGPRERRGWQLLPRDVDPAGLPPSVVEALS